MNTQAWDSLLENRAASFTGYVNDDHPADVYRTGTAKAKCQSVPIGESLKAGRTIATENAAQLDEVAALPSVGWSAPMWC